MRRFKREEPQKTPTYLPTSEIADNFCNQLVENTRKRLALRKRFPGLYVRYKRAAYSGPNSEFAVLVTKVPGQPPETNWCPYARLEELAEAITNEEVYAEMDRAFAAMTNQKHEEIEAIEEEELGQT